MSTLAPSSFLLLGFVASLFTLAWLSRQISVHIQIPVYHLTRSQDALALALFLVFLPGVVIHEGAHWLAARLLGLKTGKFRVWPKRRGRQIGLGSVTVQSGGVFIDSLVGLAPLLVGSFFITLIAHRIFHAHSIADSLVRGQITDGFVAFWSALGEPDGALWAYLLFAIANAMMPSASDREPVKPVLLYALLAGAIYFVLGLPLNPVTSLLSWAAPVLQNLSSAFLFTIVLDVGVLAVLYLIRLFIGT